MKQTHPLIEDSIQRMLIDAKYQLPFYGELNLGISFKDRKDTKTMGVYAKSTGIYCNYNSEFLDSLNTVKGKLEGDSEEEFLYNKWERQKQVNFLILHNNFHILFDHPQRGVSGQFDQKLAEVAQDMIINSTILDDINEEFISVPKYIDTKENKSLGIVGRNMALFLPAKCMKGDGGTPIFEELYNWLKEEQRKFYIRKRDNSCPVCSGDGDVNGNQCGECEGSGHDRDRSNDYGYFGVYGDDLKKIKCFSLDSIFELIEKEHTFMDDGIPDEVSNEMRNMFVRDMIDNLRTRGLVPGEIEETLNKLRKKRKDYLREIKRSISKDIIGHLKHKTISRPNRRGIEGLKGNKKYSSKVNVIMDTSGSMYGMFEKVLEYVFQKDIAINMCQVDTEVHSIETISSMRDMQRMDIKGLGGTMLQPAVELIASSKEYNKYNTVILTDGYCDTLDLNILKGKVLAITCGTEIPLNSKPKKGYKEIIVESPK